jgi:formylglycine-generating enzyme required for sulfatase activity
MVLIPGGEFTMGTEADYAFSNESPPHRVTVAPFWLDVNAVTNDDFARFIESTGYLTVAIGCTGGQHRSVHCVEMLARRLSGASPTIRVRHRSLLKRGLD